MVIGSFVKSLAALNYAPDQKTVISFNDEDFYTDEDIKENFIKTMTEQDLLKPVITDIVRLVNEDILIPVMTSKGLISKIRRYYKAPIENKMVLAFFNSLTEKIYVLMENNTDFIFWSKSDTLASVVLHEFQHFCSYLFPNEFTTIHAKSLIAYYKRFFKLQFGVELDDNDSKEIYIWLFKNSEYTGADSVALLVRYAVMLDKIMKSYGLGESDRFNKISSLMKVIRGYAKDSSEFIHQLQLRNQEYLLVVNHLYQAYRAIKIGSLDNLCIQELLFPSEIICVESQYNASTRHYQLISKIK